MATPNTEALPPSERVCDLLVAGTTFPVLITAFESGLLELRLQVCSVFPAWPHKSPTVFSASSSASKTNRAEVLVLFDRLDVAPSILRGCGKLDGVLHPSLYPDPLHLNVWYVRHSGGVECVALPSLDAFASQLLAALDETAATPQPAPLPRAEVAPLLQRDALSVGSRLLGMCVIALAAGAYFLAYECEEANGSQLRCLDLLGAPSSVETAAASSDVFAAKEDEEKSLSVAALPSLHAAAAWVAELKQLDLRRPKAIPRVETLASGRLTRLQQMQEATQLADAYKRHAAYIAEGNAILKAAAEDIAARKAEVC